MPFVSHIGPQAIDLPLTDSIVFQQCVFYLCRLPGRRTQPVENRVFLDPFGARDTANAHALRQQRQGFQDRFARCLTSVEHRAVRFRKRVTAPLAPVALRTILGFPEADNLRCFDVAVQLARFVWAKLPHLSQFVRHVSPEHHSITGSILPATLFRETTEIYKRRFATEHSFAWVDKFRALLIRFDRKDAYFLGAHHIAFAMINLRHVLAAKA